MLGLVGAASDYYIDSSLGNLFVVNGTTGNALFNYNVTADYYFGSGKYLTDLNVSAMNLSDYIPYTGSSANVVLGDYNFSVGTSDLFVDASSGRVGIGTTTPDGNLDVVGDFLFFGRSSSGYGNVRFASGNDEFLWFQSNNATRTGSGKGFKFSGRYGTSNTMTIDIENQRVGIGTTTPQNTLNVVGDGNFTGNLSVSNQLNMFYNGTEMVIEY